MSSQALSILHTNFHRGWGGQPARILMLSQDLARRGHEVVIAAPAGSILAGRAREAGLETFEELRFLKTKRILSSLRDAAALNRLLGSRRFDLVDAHGSQDLWISALARRLGGHPLPLVFTRHNTKEVAGHLFNRILYRRAVDHLIVVSGSVLERYRSFLDRGDLDRDRISVVHSSYWEDRFHDGVDGSAIRREICAGAGPDPLLVGVIGRLVPDKGGIHFLRAAARIAPEFPSARFLFAGRGTEEEALKKAAADLGIGEKVVFLGFREDIPRITAALDLSVLPSVDCDASSAVLKEAMAVGRPVVATSIGGAGEIIRDGETGLLVPPGDPAALAEAIAAVLRRPDHGRAMGTSGRERVRSLFTRERLAEGTLEAYRKALERWARGFRGAAGPSG
jgi:glycosyltransferase involved in cell wall biosynthesis